MTTPERRDALLHMFNQVATIARTLGMTLSFADDGRAVVDLPYNPGLDHAQGGVHGGVYATLLDTAGWFTAAAAHDVDSWIATAEMSVHFLLPVRASALRAIGRLIKTGKRQDIAEMHLYDGEGRLVGHATGTFIILPDIPAEREDNDTQS
ncbi:MAG: PaaI family thioesterase [Anaerolineae bacterium]|nr:PaaI family thioesterase [Anaerolineae bacterium]